MTRADIVGQHRITDVARALGCGKLRPAGQGKFRCRAWWRDGDGENISLDNTKGCWFDFVDGRGGGVLALIQHVRGGDRQAALRWLAAAAGIQLDDRQFSRAERISYAREKRRQDRDVPIAELWRRAAGAMGEQLLAGLKAAEPAAAPVDVVGIQSIERFLAGLRRLDGRLLVDRYRRFLTVNPRLTSGMVRAAWRRRQLEERALARVLLGEIA